MGRLQRVFRAIFINEFTDPAPDHHVTDKDQADLIRRPGGLCGNYRKERTEDEFHDRRSKTKPCRASRCVFLCSPICGIMRQPEMPVLSSSRSTFPVHILRSDCSTVAA